MQSEYSWQNLDSPPVIGRHSLNKHAVLQDYLSRYIEKLCLKAHDSVRLSLIDGFAGGGIYRRPDNGNLHFGSPIIVLDTVKQMEATIPEVYKKAVKIQARYYFVEKKKSNIDILRQVIGMRPPIPSHSRYQLLQGSFEKNVGKIIDSIRSEGRKHKALFILDQYGYSEVPVSIINYIFSQLPDAEILLTFAADWLIDYLSTKPEEIEKCRIKFEKIGIEVDPKVLADLKETEPGARLVIQDLLSEDLSSRCGAKYFTRYFLQTENKTGGNSHRFLWLVHMSQHAVARDEMCKVHWANANFTSTHAGFSGIDDKCMRGLGYTTRHDQALGQLCLQYDFQTVEQAMTVDTLRQQIPKIIWDKGPMTFSGLLNHIANGTPASSEILKEVMDSLIDADDIAVSCPKSGKVRRKGSTIAWSDIVRPLTRSLFP
jgi:three-Cys-motif partner protein